LSENLLSAEMTRNMISNHSGEAECYGYGIWLNKNDKYIIHIFKAVTQVSFISGMIFKKSY
jgi:hypothetical protein